MPTDAAQGAGGGGGPGWADWLPDIGANLLCVVMVVLVAMALAPEGGEAPAPPPAARDVSTVAGPPLSAGGIVEMLYRRIEPPADVLALELRASGVHALRGGAPLPPDASWGDGPVDIYVFDHAHHGAALARLSAAPGLGRVAEASMPAALGGAEGFSQAFLDLALARPTPGRFRSDLADLLEGGPAASAAAPAPPPGLRATLSARLALLGNVLGAALAGLAIWGLCARRGGGPRGRGLGALRGRGVGGLRGRGVGG
ncbi:MAG: hypothetical protein ACU0BF_00775 [Paracoccaceae bacterium]